MTEQQPAHGETIAPLERPGRPAPSAARPSPLARRWWPTLAFVGLALVAGIVFWVLPDWGARQRALPAPAPVPEVADSGPTLSPEQIEALKQQGQALLAQLLPQQPRVEALHPGDWAPDDWTRYQTLGRNGDDAYLDADYAGAVEAYGAAVELGDTLLARADELTAQALAAGEAALAAGRPEAATERFNFVLAIDADQEVAQAGLARAEQMPKVLELVSHGEALEDAGQLDEAVAAYREAVRLDPDYAAAAKARDRALAKRSGAQFESYMSAGFAAVTSQDFDAAHEAFEAALALQPDAAAARDGLQQAEFGQSLDAIELAEARALAFERRELWTSAVEQYRSALDTDDTLDFARQGLARAQARADLDAKLENLIANPNLLFRDDILAQAKALLGDARAVDTPGPRLESQARRLDHLITLASEPLSVELKSDQMTEVTLYRVGELGAFDTKEVDLRPGTYTAVGSRDGYRDVRRTFTVLPGKAPDPIVVACDEPI